jgi:hypothetical protein
MYTNTGFTGIDTFTYRLRDSAGIFSSYIDAVIFVGVVGNTIPFVMNEIPDSAIFLNDSLKIDLTPIFGDNDRDQLSFDAESSDGIVDLIITGDTLIVIPLDVGNSLVNVKADDGRGGIIEDQFKVTVNNFTNISNANNLPIKFFIKQNYPDPFNPTTTIKYSIPKSSYVILKVYDILGREITTLLMKKNLRAIIN